MSHQTVKFQLESVLEIMPGFEIPVEVIGFAELFTDPCYGADADGNRGEVRTEVNEIFIVRIWACFPGRPEVLLADNPSKVSQFLTDKEIDIFIDQACEKVFLTEKYEEWEDL